MVKVLEQINKIIPLHHKIADYNPALEHLYPIVIGEDALFSIYDVDSGGLSYRLFKH